MFVKLSDPVLDRGIIDGTQSDALYILTDQVLKFFQVFFRNVSLTFLDYDFYIKIRQLRLRRFNAVGDFPFKMPGPVGRSTPILRGVKF